MKTKIIFLIIMILLKAFNFCNSQENNTYIYNAVCEVYAIHYIENNNKTDTMLSIGTGFFTKVNDGTYFLTLLSNVISANSVYVRYTTKNNNEINQMIIKLYPISSKYKYVWIDSERDLIIFKVFDFVPQSYISTENTTLNVNDEIKIYFKSLDTNFSGHIKNIIHNEFITWYKTNINPETYLVNGAPVFNNKGNFIGILKVSPSAANSFDSFILPSKFINFILDDITLNYGLARIEKQIDDFILNPEIYQRLIQYDSSKYDFLFK